MKPDRARLLLVAAAGIVVAHAADYALAFPDPAVRARVLSATGHSYWGMAVVAALVCGALALAVAARRGWRGDAPTASVGLTGTRLAVGQVAVFAVLETVERFAAGGHPVAFLTSAQFTLGVVLQILVALVAALLLRGVEQVARRIASLRRPRRARLGRRAWALLADDDVPRWWGTAGDARGPPLTFLV